MHQLSAVIAAFLAFPSLSFGQYDPDWPDHQIKPASAVIYPLFSYGNGCPGSSARQDTLIGKAMESSHPDGTFHPTIYLPASMSLKAPDETIKSCLSVWHVTNTTGYAMRLHKHKVGGAVNGTSVAGEYTLDDGDEFTWTTQYIVPSNGTLRREPVSPDTTYGFIRITDEVHLTGPITPPDPNTPAVSELYKEATTIDKQTEVPLPCGDAIFAIYSEFKLNAKTKHAKIEPLPGIGKYELGITHDWVKC